MTRQKCYVVATDDAHTFEVADPNNDSCPRVGPFSDRNKAKAKQAAHEQARRLNAFYRRNWRTWGAL